MTLTVATDTYLSLADADTYHAKYGNSSWTSYRKEILAIGNNSGGVSIVTKESNGFAADDEIMIENTENYDGETQVDTIVSATNFTIDELFAGVESSGDVMLLSAYQAREVVLRKATQWIDVTHGYKMLGVVTDVDQSLLYPRQGLYDDKGASIADTAIPELIKNATAELALLILSEVALYVNIDGGFDRYITEEKIGPIVTKYFIDKVNQPAQPQFIHVERILAPLMKSSGAGMARLTRS